MKFKQNYCLHFRFPWERNGVYKQGPREGGPVSREKMSEGGGKFQNEKLYQEFALGEHDVFTNDKVSKDYVTRISGSVDITPYAKTEKPEIFYQTEVVSPAEILLQLFEKNMPLFTENTVLYIGENLPVLRIVANEKPKNNKEFLRLAGRFSEEEIYGPDGILNLLLAFNRIASKLEPGALTKMMNPKELQLLKIDLQKRRTRSVEVSPFAPEIKEPNIKDVKIDLPVRVVKLMKPDGTYEVRYLHIFQNQENLAYMLDVDPVKRIVKITQYYGKPGTVQAQLTFNEFDVRVKQNPYFLHTL